jgi:hypothetical protein
VLHCSCLRYPQVTSDEREGVAYNWSFFHFTFMCASLYLTMVLTNWDVLRCVLLVRCALLTSCSHSSSGSSTVEIGDNTASVWVKIVSSWVCAVSTACLSMPGSPRAALLHLEPDCPHLPAGSRLLVDVRLVLSYAQTIFVA